MYVAMEHKENILFGILWRFLRSSRGPISPLFQPLCQTLSLYLTLIEEITSLFGPNKLFSLCVPGYRWVSFSPWFDQGKEMHIFLLFVRSFSLYVRWKHAREFIHFWEKNA